MPAHPLRVGVVYDFRNPPDSGIDTPRLYAEILDRAGGGRPQPPGKGE